MITFADIQAAASVQASASEVMVEARDSAHAGAIIAALEENYIVRRARRAK